jgi:uncharacterized protein
VTDATSKLDPAPLVELFVELRRRNFPLGVGEYVAALGALASGFDIRSRGDLIFMCQVLWAKSPDEQRQVAEAARAVLPKELTPREVEALIQAAERAAAQPAAPAVEPTPEERRTQTQATPAEPPAQNVTGRGAPSPASQAATIAETRPGFEWRAGPAVEDFAATELGDWQLNPNLDLVGQLPITERQMKRAWRYFRRMRRLGQPVELDIEATINQMHRQGALCEPVLMPRRLNCARLLLVVDAGGSMVPFERATAALLASAAHSGLARVAVYYFHDCPKQHLFRDRWLGDHVPCERALSEMAGAGALVVSDGGAARGSYDAARVEQTISFLQTLRRFTPNVAWLNPTPPERWPGTTAEAVRALAPVEMFTFSRAGLDAAVDVLRGQVR